MNKRNICVVVTPSLTPQLQCTDNDQPIDTEATIEERSRKRVKTSFKGPTTGEGNHSDPSQHTRAAVSVHEHSHAKRGLHLEATRESSSQDHQRALHDEDIVETESSMREECGGTPCYWNQLGAEIVSKTVQFHEQHNVLSISRSFTRKQAYKSFIYQRYGILGTNNRIQIPNCVLIAIRHLWPDEKGAYMGYKST